MILSKTWRGGAVKDQKSKQADRVRLQYLEHQVKPTDVSDVLDFISLPCFERRWEKLGLDDGNDIKALRLFLMMNPKMGKPIRGTKGIRKVRFAPSRWNTGKSGAARILYVYFEEYGIVLWCLVYKKGEVSNISNATKKDLNRLVEEQERELKRRGTL